MKQIPLQTLALMALLHGSCSYSAIVVQANDTMQPFGFTKKITATAFKKVTGTLFVGLDAPTADDGIFSLARTDRPTLMTTPHFKGIATNPSVKGTTIEFLSLAEQVGLKSILPFVIQAASGKFSQLQVNAIFEDGNADNAIQPGVLPQSEMLCDASGSTTAGIVQLAASNAHIFAAVRPTGSALFGAADSGIAVMNISALQTHFKHAIALRTVDAVTGLDGNIARQLDENSAELNGATSPVVFLSEGGINDNQVALYHDAQLERLYIGTRIESGPNVTDIAKSIVIGSVTGNTLTLAPIAPNSAISGGAVNELVVAQGSSVDLRAKKIGIMHTSTGLTYLIVNGGRGTTATTGNTLYALAVVDDPANVAAHGTLARKDAALTNFKFTTPATAPGHLPLNTDPAAFIGTTNLPIAAADEISDMHIIDDTVYVSINTPASAINDTGIFYSQALFASDGKIARWTPWTKRAAPTNAFEMTTLPGNVLHDGRVAFFNVDARTGSMYIVEGTTQQTVGITSWNSSGKAHGLLDSINSFLRTGVYACLDLHQGVNGLTDTKHRYALFGGINTVLFLRISEAQQLNNISSPQTVITDFSLAQNHLLTPMPIQAGRVRILEYARVPTGRSDNYFFAGTDTGLYAYSVAGNGFDAATLGTLNQPPFSTGTWTKIADINGSVVDIKTSGSTLYVLTHEPTTDNPFHSKLYTIVYQPTLSAMFSPGNIGVIAQSATAPALQDTLLFTGIQIIATDNQAVDADAADKEQLILATNQGLFKSNADQNVGFGIPSALTQAAANWSPVATTQATAFTGIYGIDTKIRHTTWPCTEQQDKRKSFTRASLLQLNGSGTGAPTDTGTATFIPSFFNALPETARFESLSPLSFFFSDGARRFFIFNEPHDQLYKKRVGVIPFNPLAWGLAAPTVLNDPVLETVHTFFWIDVIGASGTILAGTEKGVVSLS